MFRLLLVDDEKMVLVSIRHSIKWEKYGFSDIFTTTDSCGVLQLLKEIRMDAVCIDIRMPVYTAFDIIAQCQKEDISVNFLILTGYSDFNYAQKALHLGVFDYLLKPLQSDDNLACLSKLNIHLWKQRLLDDPPLYERLIKSSDPAPLLHWLGIRLSDSYFGFFFLMLDELAVDVFSFPKGINFNVLLCSKREALIFITSNRDPSNTIRNFIEQQQGPCGASFCILGRDLSHLSSAFIIARQESTEAFNISTKSQKPEFRICTYNQYSAANDTFRYLLLEIEKRFCEELSLTDLADQFNLGYSYCSTLFSKQLGMTFSQYLRLLRIEKAKELIISTDIPLHLISAQVGYPDYHYFSKIFKNEIGTTPSDYRISERMRLNEKTSF